MVIPDHEDGVNHLCSLSRKRHVWVPSLILLVLPPIITLLYINNFGINVPFWDQWHFIPLIDKLYAGNLSIADLFAQHNEHRILFPRLLMLACAYLTGYNTVAELYVSWFINVFLLGFWIFIFKEKFGDLKLALTLSVPVSWLLFNFNQYQNILWGWQIQIYLCVLCVVVSLTLLDLSVKRRELFLLSIGSAIVASYSFISGLIAWPIGALAIAFSRTEGRVKRLAIWVTSGLFTIFLYFYQWSSPEDTPSIFYFTRHIWLSAEFFFAQMGSPWTSDLNWAILLGILTFALFLISIWLVLTYRPDRESFLWITLILFTLIGALAGAIGRSGFGLEFAMKSRYITLMLPGIIGFYAISLRLWYIRVGRNLKITWGLICMTLVLLNILLGYSYGYHQGQLQKDWRENSIDVLRHYSQLDSDVQKIVYTNSSLVEGDLQILQKYNLSVYSVPFSSDPRKVSLLGSAHVVHLPDHQHNVYAWVTIGDHGKLVIFEHPSMTNVSLIRFYNVTLPENPILTFYLAIDPNAWPDDQGDGVNFIVYVHENGSVRPVFDKYLDPKHNASERTWNYFEVNLSAYSAEGPVIIDLCTSPGPNNNFQYDWAYWGDPAIESSCG